MVQDTYTEYLYGVWWLWSFLLFYYYLGTRRGKYQ